MDASAQTRVTDHGIPTIALDRDELALVPVLRGRDRRGGHD
jgi:hypothetical protein